MTTIDALGFYYCGALTDVNIPDGVTGIGDSAFDMCEKLTLSVASGSFGQEYAEAWNIRFVTR